MTPQQKAALIGHGLSGHHLALWLPGRDLKVASADVRASWACGTWGYVDRRGIHGAAGDISWRELARVVERGCRVPGLREAYELAYADCCAWANAGGYALRHESSWTAEEHEAHQAWHGRATNRLHATEAAIIEAGCTADAVQDTLF